MTELQVPVFRQQPPLPDQNGIIQPTLFTPFKLQPGMSLDQFAGVWISGYQSALGHLLQLHTDYTILADTYLRHAPNDEKFALCERIRNTGYDLADKVNQASAMASRTRPVLEQLNAIHRTLRYQWYIFYRKGYFSYRNQKAGVFNPADALRRFGNINLYIDAIGRMIGAWIARENQNRKDAARDNPGPKDYRASH